MAIWGHFREQNILLASATWLLVCLPAGCSSEEAGPELIPVSGIITVDGNPLPLAGISFRPDETKGNSSPYQPGGTADENGKYDLIAAAKQGASPGWYKVVVFPYSPPPGTNGVPKTAVPFNKKYSNPNTTDLSIEVKAGTAPGAYDLKLTK
tara:strand:- start:37125 stop:37580 length:456 start_codon:yes stop_codon:yes gene_type:complete